MSYPTHSHSPSVPNLPSSNMDPLQHGFAALSIGGGAGYGHVGHPQAPSGHRRTGSCKFFNSQKGFGFVNDSHAEELGGQEVFVHYTAINGKGGFRSLAEGEEVEYDIVQGPKGYQAANLTGPQGRPVIGDPKARLPKPHQFMSISPMHPLVHSLQSAGVLSALAYGNDSSYAQQAGPYGQPFLYTSVPALHNHSLSMSQIPYSPASPASRNLMQYQGAPGAAGLNGMPSSINQTPINGYGMYPQQQQGGRSPYAANGGLVGLPGNISMQGGQGPVFGQPSLPGSGMGGASGSSANPLYNGVNRGAVGDGSPSRANSSRFNNRSATPPAPGAGTGATGSVPIPTGVTGSHVRADSTGGSLERPASKNEGGVNGSGPTSNGTVGTPTQSNAQTPGGQYSSIYSNSTLGA